MAWKKSLKKEPRDKSEPVKLAKVYQKIFSIIKFILGICLLPFVYSSTVSFLNEFALTDISAQHSFWAGVITLLLIYLFVWEPAPVYAKGHRLLEIVFSFFQPLVKVAPYLVPIYTLVLVFAYAFLIVFIKEPWLPRLFMFLFGFSLALHFIFSSKTIRSQKDDFLKSNYIFGSAVVYLLNIGFVAFAFGLIFKAFSFVNFANVAIDEAQGILYAIFRQLFLNK